MSDFGVSNVDMQRDVNRGELERFWNALIEGRDQEAMEVYKKDAVVRSPQTGETVAGRADIAAHGLLGPGEKLVQVNRIVGDGGVWISECETLRHQQATLLLSVAEMHDGKIARETRYRAPKQT
jgi:hypothetical protein